MENADLRKEFWKLFEECGKKAGFPKLNYFHYTRLNDFAKARFEEYLKSEFEPKKEETLIDSEDETFLDKIAKINEKLPEKDQIKDKDSFLEFAKKANELDNTEEKNDEEEEVIEEEKPVVTSETRTENVKKTSVFKRIGNYFANMSPTSKIINGVALGLVVASALFAGPATLLEPVGLVLMAIPATTFIVRPLIKSFKSGKIRELINDYKNKKIELPAEKSEEIKEDIFKGFNLPKEDDISIEEEVEPEEELTDIDDVVNEVRETVDDVEREVKKDGFGPRDFILPGTDDEEIDLPTEENIDSEMSVRSRREVNPKWNNKKEQIKMVRQREHFEPAKNRLVPTTKPEEVNVNVSNSEPKKGNPRKERTIKEFGQNQENLKKQLDKKKNYEKIMTETDHIETDAKYVKGYKDSKEYKLELEERKEAIRRLKELAEKQMIYDDGVQKLNALKNATDEPVVAPEDVLVKTATGETKTIYIEQPRHIRETITYPDEPSKKSR